MNDQTRRWVLGLVYIFAVAVIWITASFVVQTVEDAGVSPFVVTYICNALFLVYIPLVEIGRYLEDKYGSLLFWQKGKGSNLENLGDSEELTLLGEDGGEGQDGNVSPSGVENISELDQAIGGANLEVDAKGRWTRTKVAKVSLLICPFWFLAQLSFNFSLKYTTVTSNTILSSSSSLFTFVVALIFLGEKFTWVKLISVLLCMGGTIIVSLGDSETKLSMVAPNPALGDTLALLSSVFYAAYITLLRKKLPDEDNAKNGRVSMAQFLGFMGLFNALIFLPAGLILNLANLEPSNVLTMEQFGLIVGKGFLDNVLSDYLWAKAVLLTTTTVATAGLSIQVPLAAVVDSLTGNAPNHLDYIGAAAVLVGFAGMNIPSDVFSRS